MPAIHRLKRCPAHNLPKKLSKFRSDCLTRRKHGVFQLAAFRHSANGQQERSHKAIKNSNLRLAARPQCSLDNRLPLRLVQEAAGGGTLATSQIRISRRKSGQGKLPDARFVSRSIGTRKLATTQFPKSNNGNSRPNRATTNDPANRRVSLLTCGPACCCQGDTEPQVNISHATGL